MKSLLDTFFPKKKTCAKRKMDIKRTVGKKGRESSFGKAFLKPFCFAKAFTENTSWKKRFVLRKKSVCWEGGFVLPRYIFYHMHRALQDEERANMAGILKNEFGTN